MNEGRKEGSKRGKKRRMRRSKQKDLRKKNPPIMKSAAQSLISAICRQATGKQGRRPGPDSVSTPGPILGRRRSMTSVEGRVSRGYSKLVQHSKYVPALYCHSPKSRSIPLSTVRGRTCVEEIQCSHIYNIYTFIYMGPTCSQLGPQGFFDT